MIGTLVPAQVNVISTNTTAIYVPSASF